MKISYKGFCALGDLTNLKPFSRVMRNGSHSYIKYYYMNL